MGNNGNFKGARHLKKIDTSKEWTPLTDWTTANKETDIQLDTQNYGSDRPSTQFCSYL